MPTTMRTHLVATGLVVMWSSGFIGAELGTREAPADTLLMWRFLVAAALLAAAAPVLRRRRTAAETAAGHKHHGRRPDTPGGGGRLPLRALGEQSLIGLLSQGVYLGAIVWSVGLGVPAGTSALIAALQPLAAGALAGRLLGETVTGRQWAGLVLGLAGVAAVVRDDLGSASAAPAPAYLLPFAGMAGLLAASFLERRARHQVGAAEALPVHCAVSAALFTGVAACAGDGHLVPPPTTAFWLAVAWVVAFSTFGGYGFYWLSLRDSGVTRTSALIYLTPPTTLVWAYVMFGDAPGGFAVAGMAVALAGVVVALRSSAPRRPGRSRVPLSPPRSRPPASAEREAAERPAKEPQSTAARYDRHDGNDSRLEPPAQYGPGGD
ncbi:DMT family transporter [Streptomyces sp. WMMB 322]|uniref:DMT family transporter n=1 Tax=Streptomyces sp. WMMB 322 TaxID=1286821 RepID=UPI0008239433|nr:DMT family transporter [Streptomyces sp. WMMB 322]SCK22635.1 Permease of the drug/metabolite transporter (DMT) superfamily [Streptomyces sp. WMMB 322]